LKRIHETKNGSNKIDYKDKNVRMGQEALMLRVLEFLGSKLGLNTGYLHRQFSCSFSTHTKRTSQMISRTLIFRPFPNNHSLIIQQYVAVKYETSVVQ